MNIQNNKRFWDMKESQIIDKKDYPNKDGIDFFLRFKTTQIYILISPVDVFWDPFITFKQVKLLSFFFHDNNQSNSINYYMRANFQSNLSPQKLYRPTIQQQQRDGLFVITRFFSTLLPLCSHNIQRNESSSDFKNQH